MSLLQYSTLLFSIAILYLLGLVILPASLPCVLPLFLFILLHGYVLGQYLFSSETPLRTLLGILLIIPIVPLSLTPLYWFFGYYSWYPVLPVLLLSAITAVIIVQQHIPIPRIRKPHIPCSWSPLGTILALMLPVLLLTVVMQKMTGNTLFSPWQLIGPKFWILSAVSLPLLLWSMTTSISSIYRYSLLSLWYLVIYTLILCTHKYAFGFDQHIHLASMQWIRDHGLLEPKVPYYLGQYLLAIPLAEITRLPLDWMSRAIVPIIAAFTLPLLLLQKKTLHPATQIFLPILPLGFLTFTTPNNLALLLSLLTIITVWIMQGVQNRYGGYLLIGVLTAWVTITHALIGVPLIGILLVLLGWRTWQHIIGCTILIAGVPVLLALYGGGTTIVFEPQVLFHLFAQPHWYIGTTDSTFLQTIYTYKRFFMLPLLGSIVAFGIWKERHNKLVHRLLSAILGICLSSFVIATMVRFPALIAYEQTSYAERLFSLALVLLIPLFLIGINVILSYTRTRPQQILLLTIAIPLLLISWYFTYPTRDAISYYTGVNIRDVDIEAISFIESHAQGEPYIVLTNQIISVAALSRFGFDRYLTVPSGSEEYLYSIPTGGPLYQYFREYIYEGYDRTSIDNAMAFAGVGRAYLIHTNYWAPAGEIRDISTEVADAWWEFGEGVDTKVWVFKFDFSKTPKSAP